MVTQQPRLQINLEEMQIEVRLKEPMDMLSQLNQVSIQFNLYNQIKEAQQKDNTIKKILEKVQEGKLRTSLLIRKY